MSWVLVGVLMRVSGVVALAIVHKIFAALFGAALIALFVYKLVTNKRKEA